MIYQLQIPFSISHGCAPYYSKYINKMYEACPGGLIFEIGTKPACRECAKTCQGCVEMAINYGYSDFEDLKHLIQNPKILKPIYKKKYKKWNTTT